MLSFLSRKKYLNDIRARGERRGGGREEGGRGWREDKGEEEKGDRMGY